MGEIYYFIIVGQGEISMSEQGRSASTVERALDILWLMYRENRELGVTEIAQHIGVYKSAVHRTLTALQKKGFVEQNAANGKYWLGMAVFSMGMAYRNKITLKDVCRPFLEELAQKLNESVNLGILDKTKSNVILIDRLITQKHLTMVPPVGSGSPAHSSGIGKAILSYLDDIDIEKVFSGNLTRFTANTITDFNRLKEEFRVIRDRGYSIDNEELEIGLMCVAAPIFNKEGVIAAFSVSGPTGRFQGERFIQIVNEVKNTSKLISEKLRG
mgnify:CR=1 FL=1